MNINERDFSKSDLKIINALIIKIRNLKNLLGIFTSKNNKNEKVIEKIKSINIKIEERKNNLESTIEELRAKRRIARINKYAEMKLKLDETKQYKKTAPIFNKGFTNKKPLQGGAPGLNKNR